MTDERTKYNSPENSHSYRQYYTPPLPPVIIRKRPNEEAFWNGLWWTLFIIIPFLFVLLHEPPRHVCDNDIVVCDDGWDPPTP